MSDRSHPDEFELIRRHFAPLATDPNAFGLTDDAAILQPAPGRDLVLTADALIEGVHFRSDDPADLVARKLLRVNVSDLAAMGAMPIGYLLTTAWPEPLSEAWIATFCSGLAMDQAEFGITLLGGDTVSTSGPLALSLTAIGGVAKGKALTRAGARPADLVFVTGTIGDGMLGLRALRQELGAMPFEDLEFLATRYQLPQPRSEIGARLVGIAHAAIDVSDGLLADAGHIADTSGVKLTINSAEIPLSKAACRTIDAQPGLWPAILAGGDDYELLFSMPPEARDQIRQIASETKLPITQIGFVSSGNGVALHDQDGKVVEVPNTGWRHF